jgi:hypothetical protein
VFWLNGYECIAFYNTFVTLCKKLCLYALSEHLGHLKTSSEEPATILIPKSSDRKRLQLAQL